MKVLCTGRDGSRRRLLVAVVGSWALLAVAPSAHAAISINDVSVNEGATGAQLSFTITKTAVFLGGNATVRFRTISGGTATAGADYTANSGQSVTLSNPLAGSTTQVVNVPVLADALDEVDETVLVAIDQATGDTITDGAGTGTITDDDAPPTASISGTDRAEGTGTAGFVAFPVALSAPSGQDITLPYTVAPGTAVAPDDIDATGGSVTIAAGATGAEIQVPTVADNVDEPDETLSVTLGAATAGAATLGTTVASGTVVNDDTPTVTIGGVALAEGTAATATPFLFPATLSNPSVREITVRVKSSDVQAKAPADYATHDEVITFPAGDTGQIVTVPVVADATREPDEAFAMTLSEPVGVTLGAPTAVGAILDDDTPRPAGGGAGAGGGSGTGSGTGTGGSGISTVPDPPTVTVPGDRDAPRVQLTGLKLRRPSAIRATVTCPVGEARCTGRVNVFSLVVRKAKVKALRREIRMARGSFTLTGGQSVTLTMKLSATGAKALRAAKRVKVRAFGVASDTAGNTATTTATATLRR